MAGWPRQIGVGLRPGWTALRRGDWASAGADLTAGLTVAAYLVPQVLAYAAVAGMAPVTGLWASVAAIVGYVLVGSSTQLSIGPESTTAIMTAISIAPLAGGAPARYAVLAGALATMVGALCVVGWVARLGFLADLLSRPVLVGYQAGIALTMIVGQLGNLTGIPTSGDTITARIGSVARGTSSVNVTTLLVSVTALALLLTVGRIHPRAPGPLIVVLLATAATSVFALNRRGVAVVGAVPVGLPDVQLPPITGGDVVSLLLPALSVAVVGYSDTVLTGRAFASRRAEGLDAGREMLALGVANLAAGLLHGFPVSSSGSRTAIGDAAGSRSQLYSCVVLIAVVAVLYTGSSVVALLPTAVLAALVVYAAARLIDLGELRRFARFRRSEAMLAVTTIVAVLALGVLGGVLAAIGLSIFDLLRKLTRPHDGILGFVPGLAGMHDVDDFPGAEQVPGLVVYRYDAPLFFANADDFRRRALAAVNATSSPPRWLLLNAEAIVELDITAVDALRMLHDELAGRGVVLAMARVKQDLLAELRRAGLAQRIGEQRLFPTLPTAVAAFRAEHPDHNR